MSLLKGFFHSKVTNTLLPANKQEVERVVVQVQPFCFAPTMTFSFWGSTDACVMLRQAKVVPKWRGLVLIFPILTSILSKCKNQFYICCFQKQTGLINYFFLNVFCPQCNGTQGQLIGMHLLLDLPGRRRGEPIQYYIQYLYTNTVVDGIVSGFITVVDVAYLWTK